MRVKIKDPHDVSEWLKAQSNWRADVILYMSAEPSDFLKVVLTDEENIDAPKSKGYRNGDIKNVTRAEMWVQFFKERGGFRRHPVWVYGGAVQRNDKTWVYEWTDTANKIGPIYVDHAQSEIFAASNPVYGDNGFCTADSPFDAPLMEIAAYESRMEDWDAME